MPHRNAGDCAECKKNKAAPEGYEHIYVHVGEPVEGEWLWGERTMIQTRVRIVNIPFFANGPTIGDEVEIRDDQDNHRWEFVQVVVPGGYLVARLMFIEPMDEHARIDLERLAIVRGARAEWYQDRLVAISGDPEILPDFVAPFLQAGMALCDQYELVG